MANIIIIDDHIDLGEISAEMLINEGHTIKYATSGWSGLVMMEGNKLPDAVILDVDMPGMTGPEVACEMLLRDAGREDIPIILVSGRNDLELIAKRMGTPYFVKKGAPDYWDTLISTLKLALEERKAPDSACNIE